MYVTTVSRASKAFKLHPFLQDQEDPILCHIPLSVDRSIRHVPMYTSYILLSPHPHLRRPFYHSSCTIISAKYPGHNNVTVDDGIDAKVEISGTQHRDSGARRI